METKKSRVTKVVHNTRQYNGANGITYYHEITFENGDKGHYGGKEDTCRKFTEGQESEYTIEEKINGQYKNYVIKPAQSASFMGRSKSGNESFALSYAKDVACAYIASGKEFKSNQIIEVAEAFYQWLQSKKA